MALVIRAVRARSDSRPARGQALLAVGAAALLAATVAGCGNGASSSGGSSSAGAKDGFTQAPQSSGPLTVWVDSTRVPAVQAYEKAHPSVKINMAVYSPAISPRGDQIVYEYSEIKGNIWVLDLDQPKER